MTSDLRKFFSKEGKFFSLAKIENKADIPTGLLSKCINKEPHRKLSIEQEKAVRKVLESVSASVKNYLYKNLADWN